jgi:hypothetical protein
MPSWNAIIEAELERLGLRETPEPPRKQVDTSLASIPTGGATVVVNPGDDPQTKYDTTVRGDTLAFAAGGTWNQKRIVLSANKASRITKTGTPLPFNTPITDAMAATYGVPTLIIPDDGPDVFHLPAGQALDGLRIDSLKLDINAGAQPSGYAVFIRIDSDSGQRGFPRQVIIDQIIARGRPTSWIKAGVSINGCHWAVINSIIEEIHYRTAALGGEPDSQAISIVRGDGPFLIRDNSLSAAAECVNIGGTDDATIPSDGIIRRNRFWKDPAWRGLYTVKNHVEFKKGRRIDISANFFDTVWLSGQSGEAISLWSVNQSGGDPYAHCSDIDMSYNVFKDVAVMLQGTPTYSTPSIPAIRFRFRHAVAMNLGGLVTRDPASGAGFSRGLIMQHVDDVTYEHVTAATQQTDGYFAARDVPELMRNMKFRSNLGAINGEPNSFMLLTGVATEAAAWALLAGAGASWDHNVFAVPIHTRTLPAETGAFNHYPASIAALGLVDSSTLNDPNAVFSDIANLKLASSSPYKGAAHDTTDPGADIDTILALTAGRGW